MRIAHLHPYRHRRSLLSLLIISTPTTKQQRSFPFIFSLSSFSTSTPAKPLLPPLRGLAMASDDLSAAVTAAEDEKFGFKRSEMFKEKLAGTVNAYDRHVFLCYKTPEAWPSRVEGSESDPLPKFFASALKVRKNDIAVKTLLTVIEGREGTEFSDGDVLIFPQMIKYRGLKESDVDSFVDDVLVNDKPWASGVQEVLTGSHVFVCAHGSRDKRCGVCGPVLIDKFKEEAELRGLTNQVFVTACSHIGGHKYAGNLIIYSPGSDGSITGHWYGYVTPDDVPELLDQHIGKGEIIKQLWRGQMGLSSDEAEKINDPKLSNGRESKKIQEKPQENGNQIQKNENFSGCCQGANSNEFTCCKEVSLEQNGGSEENLLLKWNMDAFGGLVLPGNDIPYWLGYVVSEDETVNFEVPPSIDYIRGLALCIVYSSGNSYCTGSPSIHVVNHTQQTYILIPPMVATVTASYKCYLWLGRFSNRKLNLKGGDKVCVQAKFYGTEDDDQIKAKKIGVKLVQCDLSHDDTDEEEDYHTMPYEYDDDTDNDTQFSNLSYEVRQPENINDQKLPNGGENKNIEACARKDALGKPSSLIRNREQSDVLTAAVVVGAVATVAVAYSFYRRAG